MRKPVIKKGKTILIEKHRRLVLILQEGKKDDKWELKQDHCKVANNF
jgi:hypothetical protein